VASLLIVTGPPGAGKSTIARHLVQQQSPSVLVEGDRFFGFLAEGAIDPWLRSSKQQNEIVTRAAAAATGCFAASYDTIYDGVLGPWFLPTFAAATGLAELDYVVVLPPLEVCIRRVATRTGHGFTDEPATRKMHTEFAAAAIDQRHLLRTSSDDVSETANTIRRAQAAGRLGYLTGV